MVVRCLGGKTHVGVDVNGDVVLCCLDYRTKTKIGNLNVQTLKEILDSEPYQNAMLAQQAGKAYFPICASCKYRKRFNWKWGDLIENKGWRKEKFIRNRSTN